MVVSSPSDDDQPTLLLEVWEDETCLTSRELVFEVLNRDLEIDWEAWCSACYEWGIQRFPENILEQVEEFANFYDLD